MASTWPSRLLRALDTGPHRGQSWRAWRKYHVEHAQRLQTGSIASPREEAGLTKPCQLMDADSDKAQVQQPVLVQRGRAR